MDTRQQKISMLSRANRGRAMAPEFLRRLSEVLGETIELCDLVPLEETDSLTEIFRMGYQQAASGEGGSKTYQKFFAPSGRRFVFDLADCISNCLPAETVFFLGRLTEDCGAVKLKLPTLLRHAATAIQLDGDCVSVLSGDGRQGLLIDSNVDDQERAYEIAVWGDVWVTAVLKCEKSL